MVTSAPPVPMSREPIYSFTKMDALINTLLKQAQALTKVALKFQGTQRQQLEQWRKAAKAYQKVSHAYWKQGIAGLRKSGDGLGDRTTDEWMTAFDKETANGYKKYQEEFDKIAKICNIISKKIPMRMTEQPQQEGLKSMFGFDNWSKLLKLLKRDGFTEDFHDDGVYTKAMELTADGDEGIVSVENMVNMVIIRFTDETGVGPRGIDLVKDFNDQPSNIVQSTFEKIQGYVNRVNGASPNSKKFQIKKQMRQKVAKEMGMEEGVGTEDPNNPLYVEYVKDMPHEEPFMQGGQKFQFVQAKYPNGKLDIGVYAFSGDIVYGYEAFRKMYNINEIRKPSAAFDAPIAPELKKSTILDKIGKWLETQTMSPKEKRDVLTRWKAIENEMENDPLWNPKNSAQDVLRIAKSQGKLSEQEIKEFGWAMGPDTSTAITVWEVYERDGTGCLLYLHEEDARNSDFFENGNDIISKANVRLSTAEIKILQTRQPICIS